MCSGLQAQILRCYRDNLQEVLLCSDLVKAYQHCVSAAHKVRLALPSCLGRWAAGCMGAARECWTLSACLCLLSQTC